MALILTHDDIETLLSHELCLEALEGAYRELGRWWVKDSLGSQFLFWECQARLSN